MLKYQYLTKVVLNFKGIVIMDPGIHVYIY